MEEKQSYKLQIRCEVELPAMIYDMLVNSNGLDPNMKGYNIAGFRRDYEGWKNSMIFCLAWNQVSEEREKSRQYITFINNLEKEIEKYNEGMYMFCVNMEKKIIEMFYFDSCPYSTREEFFKKMDKGINMDAVEKKMFKMAKSSRVELSIPILKEVAKETEEKEMEKEKGGN